MSTNIQTVVGPLDHIPSDIAIAMFVATVAYLVYHVVATRAGPFTARRGWWRRFIGVPLLGLPALVLPAIIDLPPLARLGLASGPWLEQIGLSAAIVAVMAPLLLLQSRRPAFRAVYPEVRLDRWTRRDHLINALSWISYLLAYEYFFRGFLLLGLAEATDPWLALALVTMAYALAHIDRWPGELFGTLFTGLAFGLAALETGSVLLPWLAHAGIAVTSDWLAARPLPPARSN